MNRRPVPVAVRTHKLPAMLLREIGRVITVFAAIEHELNLITYSVLRLTTAEGRLAVTRQNVRSRMDLLRALFDIGGFEKPSDWEVRSKELQDLEEIRDWVAHGVWSIDKGSPALQITRGTWKPNGYQEKVDRKVVPASAPIQYETLRDVAIIGGELLGFLEHLHAGLLEQQKSSRGKHLEEPRHRAIRQSRRKSTKA